MEYVERSGLCVLGLRSRGCGPVDLRVRPGEAVVLSGPSGAGKTLLLRAIADLDPHEGRVFLDGRECESFAPAEWRRAVALLPAESQWWHETVGAHMNAIDPSELAALGFSPDVVGWEVARLSSGERQRLSLLRLLRGQPRVLLLDEPTAHLDDQAVESVLDRISRYREETQAPVVWVTHDPRLGERMGARCLELDGGLLQGEGVCS